MILGSGRDQYNYFQLPINRKNAARACGGRAGVSMTLCTRVCRNLAFSFLRARVQIIPLRIVYHALPQWRVIVLHAGLCCTRYSCARHGGLGGRPYDDQRLHRGVRPQRPLTLISTTPSFHPFLLSPWQELLTG